MLPQSVRESAQFVAADWTARKLVCCLALQGKEISEDSLRYKFHNPEVWITDLMNNWNLEQAPYRPRLFVLIADAAFRAHKFGDESTFMNGGLLLPLDSQVDPQGHLMINQERYRAKFIERPLADDDGAVYIYTLTPSSGAKQIVVEVPFGNN
jgi:predicted RNA methylase